MLSYNSDKFDSSLNTYREHFSNSNNIPTTEGNEQQYESSILIPLDFSLEMDGISGIIPNSAFEVPSNVLPNSYLTKKKESKIAFILHTVDHNFANSKWTTKITGQTLLIRFDPLPPEEIQKREELRYKSTKNDSIVSIIQSDDYPPNLSKDIVITLPSLTKLKNLIGTYESRNNYSIANTGGSARKSKINVNGLTFNTLKFQQDIQSENNDQRVFAAGRFQIIPSTMSIIKSKLGLRGTDRYDPITQEKMGDYLLLENRRALGNYIKGINEGTSEQLASAVNAVGYEWASMPVTKKSSNGKKVGDIILGTGQSGNYGGSGANPSKAHVSVKLLANTIINARIEYTKKKPTFIPTYYNFSV